MSAQRHRIRRQVLELEVQDPAAAWPLQAELSRIQTRQIEALIDRCCTEAGDPDRLHRLGSLVLDLGRLDPESLEEDLVEKLGPALRRALSTRIREDDEETARTGGDPESAARLELVSRFARTGHLPWWADTSRPHLVDEAVAFLIEHAAPSLVTLVRLFSRERAPLRRLVLHCADERLAALLGLLLAGSRPDLRGRPAELRALLNAHGAIPGVPAASFRASVWMGVLRAACLEESSAPGRMGFWREALVRTALEAGVTYGALVTGLHDIAGRGTAGWPGALGELVRSLVAEMRGEAGAGDSVSAGGALTAARDSASRATEPSIARDSAPRAMDPGARRDSASPGEDTATAGDSASPRGAPAGVAGPLPHDGTPEPTSWETEAHAIERLLSRLEAQDSPFRGRVARLRALVRDVPGPQRSAVLEVLKELYRQASTHAPSAAEAAASLDRALRHVAEREGLSAPEREQPVEEALREAAPRGRSELDETGEITGTPGDGGPLRALLGELRAPIHAAAGEGAGETPRAPILGHGDSPSRGEPPGAAPEPPGELPGSPESARSLVDHEDGTAGIEPLLLHLSRDAGPLGELFVELRAAVHDAPTPRRAALREVLRALDRQSGARGLFAPETAAAALSALRWIIEERYLPLRALEHVLERMRREGPESAAPARGPVERAIVQEARRLLQEGVEKAARRETGEMPAPVTVQRDTAPEPGARGGVPSHDSRTLEATSPGSPPRDIAPISPEPRSSPVAEGPAVSIESTEPDEVYVENAGLVVLWPFLGHLFERLELTADRKFKDGAARIRAAGLLHHLATGDLEPVEYQLPLAKVLCGIPMDEVFDFDPPVTEVEFEECAVLLEAAIANAPILGKMSIPGFRGSFLIRKGILTTRDGAWLLRVERATHDIVLDRFPWSFAWIKLPWMEAPLCVEW